MNSVILAILAIARFGLKWVWPVVVTIASLLWIAVCWLVQMTWVVGYELFSSVTAWHGRMVRVYGLQRVALRYLAVAILLPFVVGVSNKNTSSTHSKEAPKVTSAPQTASPVSQPDDYAEELNFNEARKLEHQWYAGEPRYTTWQDLSKANRSGELAPEQGNLDRDSCFRLAEGIGKLDQAHQACYRTTSPRVWQAIQELSSLVSKQGVSQRRYRIESLARSVEYVKLMKQGSLKTSHNWGAAFDIDLNDSGLKANELEALHRGLYEMACEGKIIYYMEGDTCSANFPLPYDLSQGGQMHVVVAPASFGLGRGSWIYALDRLELAQVSSKLCHTARQKEQIRIIVAKAKKNRLSYLIVRTSHHGSAVATCPDNLAAMLRDACHAQGIQVWGYGRISAENVAAEVECAQKVLRPARNGGLDFDGYIYDAEGEKGETRNRNSNVEAMLSTVHCWLKATVPNKRLAYSTYGIIRYHNFHSWFPRDLYDKYCHYAMPQLYWVSWRQGKLRWSLEESIRQSNAEWKDCPIPVIPTVQSYKWVKPNEMIEFLSGLDTSLGFNTFRWELTGAQQWSATATFRCANREAAAAKAQPQALPKPKGKLTEPPAMPGRATPPAMPLSGSATTGKLKGVAVVLDAGHGGPDGGTSWFSPDGVPFCESTITYMMAWELAEMLQRQGATVYLSSYSQVCLTRQTAAQQLMYQPSDAVFTSDGSRTNSNNPGLRSRVAAATLPKGFPKDKVCFVSLHIDSTAGHLKGVHVLRKLKGSNPLADAIGAELTSSGLAWNHHSLDVVGTSTKRSKHRKGYQSLYVLDANPLVNVAMLECGFPKADGGDDWRLRSPAHRRRILVAIAAAIENTYNPKQR